MSGTSQVVQQSQSTENSLFRKGQGGHSCPQLSRKFVARRISEGETGRLKEQLKCQSCGKGYKHVSSLAKHLWEHTPEWNVTSKLLISKHQQVQLLEAASILVSMNEEEVESTNDETSSQDGVNESCSSTELNDESENVKRETTEKFVDVPESADKKCECQSESALLSPAREIHALGAKPIAKPLRRNRRASSSSYGSLTQLDSLDSLVQLASPLDRDSAVFPPRRRRYTATRESHVDEDGLQDPEDSEQQAAKCGSCSKHTQHSRSNSYIHKPQGKEPLQHSESHESASRYPNSIFDPKEEMGGVFGPMEV